MKPREASVDVRIGKTRPLRIALTGGIAVGKSTVEEILRKEGVEVLDTDSIAHQCLCQGHPAYVAIVREFGEDVLLEDGTLDRHRLGELVFNNTHHRIRLNQIVHPYVKEKVYAWLKQKSAIGSHAVVAVPLLFEADMETGWDFVLCVDADEDVVLRRLAGRGLSCEQAQARIDSQMSQQKKRNRSDGILENNGSLEDLRNNVLKIWRAITQKEQTHD